MTVAIGSIIGLSTANIFNPVPFVYNAMMLAYLLGFSGYVMYDVYNIVKEEEDDEEFDPMVESFSIYYDMISVLIDFF